MQFLVISRRLTEKCFEADFEPMVPLGAPERALSKASASQGRFGTGAMSLAPFRSSRQLPRGRAGARDASTRSSRRGRVRHR